MTKSDVTRIEEALGVTLPEAYRSFVTSKRDFDEVDDRSIFDDAESVIEATEIHRRGVSGLQPWPHHFVYIGDEDDACPYVIDCTSSEICRLHKGNAGAPPFETFDSFDALLAKLQRSSQEAIAAQNTKVSWFYVHRPMILVLVAMFVVIPAIAFGVMQLFKWLFR